MNVKPGNKNNTQFYIFRILKEKELASRNYMMTRGNMMTQYDSTINYTGNFNRKKIPMIDAFYD